MTGWSWSVSRPDEKAVERSSTDSSLDLAHGRRGRLSPHVRLCQLKYRGLFPFLIVEFVVLQAIIFGGQDSIKLFDENEEFVAIFFNGDKGTEFLNAVAVCFIHEENREQLKHLAGIQYVRHRTTGGTVREGIKYGKSGVPLGGKSQ
jgi:hypothetical protein